MKPFFKTKSKKDHSYNTMALPARVSLWLGLIIMVSGYYYQNTIAIILGLILTIVGIGMWWKFSPSSQILDWPQKRWNQWKEKKDIKKRQELHKQVLEAQKTQKKLSEANNRLNKKDKT